jgi:hypothetical protein
VKVHSVNINVISRRGRRGNREGAEELHEVRNLSGRDEVTGVIVDAAYRLHTRIGPGLLENVYEAILVWVPQTLSPILSKL